MKIWPVFLDFVPHYLGRSGGSLLQTPIGHELLVSRLCDRVQAVTPNKPVILPPQMMSGPAYRATMSAACPEATILPDAERLVDSLPPLETSDVLLFVDARCFPVDDVGIAALLDEFSAARQIPHHLVAFEASVAGMKEHVNTDGHGRVRSIHRYYEPATWPFLAGVAASLVPVSSSLLYLDLVPASLVALRQQLAGCGAPSRDIAVVGAALDLTKRHGLLAAMEHCVREEAKRARVAGRGATVLVGEGHSIAPTARILGPVVIHPDVCIGEHATIVGPALIGAGAQVSSGAVVAHAVVGPHSQVPRDRTLRDRVWFNDLDDRSHERPGISYWARLERFSFLPDTTSAIAASEGVSHRWHFAWKRRFDVVASFLGLVFLSPLFLLVAALIRLESRGPILYRSVREGWRGRLFGCLKFRTMQVGAHGVQHLLKAQDKLDGPHFKLDQDPRVTRLGRILRTTNIDELPQLINVLRGDMSLVGPRPSPFRENQICVPWREGRLSVRPGVTGLWQVCRHDRSSGDFHQWIEYDLLYVQQASPWLDLKILLATVVTLAGRVPVPAAWLVRLPPPLQPAAEADGGEQARPSPPQTATERAGASSRTA
jgi:lipopolysaccharide/colanic/teichoic acid biosynthesis glycosyltransferase